MPIDHRNLKAHAQKKEQENWDFRQFLKFYEDLSEEELDQLVFSIADKVELNTQCTLCGQCCRELRPTLSDTDKHRLAQGLGVPVEQLRRQFLEYTHEDGESQWQIKSIPCMFFKDNKCTVYAFRPQDCRDYPYLHEPDFNSRTWGMIERTFTCPIVYHVMEELKKRLKFRSRRK